MRIQTVEPSTDTQSLKSALASSDVILDAIFGFSFKPPVRAPFDAALPLIANSGLPIVSVDVPSGWNVDEGKVDALALDPDVLISLTAPKEGVRAFKGRHFLGGRFVPKYVYCRIICACVLLTGSSGRWKRSCSSTCRSTLVSLRSSSCREQMMLRNCEEHSYLWLPCRIRV